jgi:acyl-CoA synthetase (NDP forming)
MHQADAPALADFFRPRNIALIGASDRSAWSRLIHSRFAQYGHEGRLFAVNRSGAPAHGAPGHTSCAQIPDRVDMAYVYVPAAATADALRDAAAAGIRNAVVLTSGFAEAGPEGAALQDEVAEVARQAGIRMLGPNSLGFVNLVDRCVTTSIATRPPPRVGRVGIVSQSGAVANEINKFAHAQGIGVSFVGATGNEAQMGVAEVLDYLVDDPGTGAVALYVEGVRNPARFTAAAQRAREARKPIVLIKLGRSPVAAEVALAHTGARVGDDAVFDAMCRRTGIVRVGSIEELVITAHLLERTGVIDPPRVAMASISGGACAIYADLAHRHGLATPPFAPQTRAALREVLPPFAAVIDPLDVTGVVVSDPSLWEKVIPILAADPGIGLLLANGVLPNTPLEVANLGEGVAAAAAGVRAAAKPALLGSMILENQSEVRREFLDGIGMAFAAPDLDLSVRALANLQRWSERMLQPAPADPRPVNPAASRPTEGRALLDLLAAHGAPIGEAGRAGCSAAGSLDLAVRVWRDPDWGLALSVAAAGVLGQLLEDRPVRLLPLGETDVRDALLALKAARLLTGELGAAPADLDRLCAAVVAIGDAALALGDQLARLDADLQVDGPHIAVTGAAAAYAV